VNIFFLLDINSKKRIFDARFASGRLALFRAHPPKKNLSLFTHQNFV
jgi:hypothetical protein